MSRSEDRSDRPLLVIIARVLAPYRHRLHLRIAREIPEVRLASLVLKRTANQPWNFEPLPDINVQWLDDPRDAAASQKKRKRKRRMHLTLLDWRKAGRVIRWMRRQPDCVVITGYNDIGRARIIRWCHARGVPIYMFSDSNAAGDSFRTKRGLTAMAKRGYVRWIVSRLSGLLVCGRGGVEYYRPYGGESKPHFYVPHEADYELVEKISDEQIDRVRREYGLKPERRLMTYCGRLVRVKRVDLLIDAFTAIAMERPEWDLLIIGDGPLRQDLQSRVPEELKNRVTWAGFVNDRDTIYSLYRASDMFVLPSEFEPWGAVVSEACAAGLGVVSSDVVGAALELVRDGVNGRIFESRNLDALIDALRDVTQPGRIEAMGKASRDVLADWRHRGDPVDGIRAMLCHAGVLDKSEVPCRQPIAGVTA